MTVITYVSRIVVGMVVGQKPLGVKYPEDLQLVINANANTPSYILVLETMLSVVQGRIAADQISLEDIALETARATS